MYSPSVQSRMSDRDDYESYCFQRCNEVYSTMTDVSEEPTTTQIREDIARFRFVFGRRAGCLEDHTRTTELLSHDIRSSSRDFKLAPPEYTS
jgi:hypothetical protein